MTILSGERIDPCDAENSKKNEWNFSNVVTNKTYFITSSIQIPQQWLGAEWESIVETANRTHLIILQQEIKFNNSNWELNPILL